MRLIGFDKKVIAIVNDAVDRTFSVTDDYEEDTYIIRVKLKNSESFNILTPGDSNFFSITELIHCTDYNSQYISLWKNDNLIFKRKLEENEILILERSLPFEETLCIQLKNWHGEDLFF